jgi:hypothetical protein
MKFKELLNVCDLYENKVDEHIKQALSTYGTVDNAPQQGLPKMEDVIRSYSQGEIAESSTVLCVAKVGEFWSDPTYNRIDQLRYGNHKRHIEARGGYSNDAADVLSAYLRPTLKPVLTKGNNRTTMRYACGRDRSSRIVVALKLHRKSASLEEMIKIESQDHNTDCNYRTSQSGDDRFKSAYYAQENWALTLFEFCKEFNIGIAGTLDGAEFKLHSHSYLQSGIREAGETYVRKYLTAFTSNKCSDEITGNCVVAGPLFLRHFRAYIEDVDKKNNCDSFSDCMKYFFKQYGEQAQLIDPDGKNLTQADITAGNGLHKGDEPAIARFVCLYNYYCRVKKLEIKGTQNTAIPFDGANSTAWNKFLANSTPLIKPILGQLATTKFF